MKYLRLAIISVIAFFISENGKAQKKVLTYPFDFEKSYLQKKDYDAYFGADNSLDKIPLVLHDNKKAEYVMLNKDFKVESKFTTDIEKTVFNEYSEKYLGGAGLPGGNVFHFVYDVSIYKYYGITSKTTHKYMVETVDFNTKKISQKELMEKPKEEDELISFSNYGSFYFITANDKTSELTLYCLDGNGNVSKRTVPIDIPEGKTKSRDKLSEYLGNTKLINEYEEVGLETSIQSSKLFDYKDKLVFVVNDNASPTHMVSIDKNSFKAIEKFIDHSQMFNTEGKEKAYVNSFLSGDKLFSLVLNKKDIQVAIYNASTGALLKKQEINETNFESALAQSPSTEERKGRKVSEKPVTNFSKLVKALTKGTEGLSVTTNAQGQYIVSIGTYDFIPHQSGAGPSHTYLGSTGMAGSTALGPNHYVNYVPGTPIYTTGMANYYRSTSFKLILNTKDLNIAKGKLPLSVNEQVKDYMDEANGKRDAIRQFAIGDHHYYGYYDKKEEAYIVERILISM